MNLRTISKLLGAAAVAAVFSCSPCAGEEKQNLPSLKRLLEESRPGQWVRMREFNGIETVLLASKREGQTLYVETHTFRKRKPQGWQQQVIDIPNQKVVTARIKYLDGGMDEISGEEIESALQGYENYKYVGEEKITVPAGTFLCRHYRTIVNDYLIHVWLSDKVPLTQIVKTSYQGKGSSVLLDYGSEGVQPAFE